MSLKLNQ